MSDPNDGKWSGALWTYYRKALKAINKDRWLIAIPLVPFVFDFIFFRLPMQLQFVRAMDPGLRAFYSHRDLFTPVWLDFAFWRRLFHRLPYAPGNLHAAYFSLFIESEQEFAVKN